MNRREKVSRWWYRWAGTVAFLAAIVIGFLGYTQNHKAVHQIKTEGLTRRAVQAEINRYVCRENNKQDRLLAGLLVATLKDTHPEQLTPEQLEAFRVFNEALHDLQHEAPCNVIAFAFLEASDTEDLEAIREVLRENGKLDGDPPGVQGSTGGQAGG